MSTRRPPSSATTQPHPKQPRKNKHRPRLNPSELSYKISTFFSPTLFPRLPPAPPHPPSLAYSRLPPPCAELDPAPAYRVRRFKLWRNQVVELRRTVLDPTLRGHLVRYQTYALPNISHWSRGVQRKIFPRGLQIKDYSAWPSLRSIKNRRSSKEGKPAPQPKRPFTPSLEPPPAQPVKKPGPERRKERERLKQHKWVLHAENERRWRQCMREIMADVVYFQDGCMLEASKWKDGVGVWLPDFNVDDVIQRTKIFRDIRRRPDTVFAVRPDIPRVKGRAEVDAAIKANEADRKARKAERRQKRMTDQAKATPVEGPPPAPGVTANARGQSEQSAQTKKDKGNNRSDISRSSTVPNTSRTASTGHIAKPDDSLKTATHIKSKSKTPSANPPLPNRPNVSDKSYARIKTPRRPSPKSPASEKVAQTDTAGTAKRMTKEDTSSLFRLLQHMADLQTKRDDLIKREEGLKMDTAQKSGGATLEGSSEKESDGNTSVASSLASTSRIKRSEQSVGRTGKVMRSNGKTRNRSDTPIPNLTASSTNAPSVTSSATAHPRHYSLRPGSLNIDDDTLHPPSTPSDMSATLDPRADVGDLDLSALQALIRAMVADGK